MKGKIQILSFLVIFLSLIAASCGARNTGTDDDIAASVSATQTVAAYQAQQAEQETGEEETAEDPPQEAVVHVMVPEGPIDKINSYLTDFNSLGYANEGFTYGDQFLINRYERPFTVGMAEYRGSLDIILANLKVEPPWIFVDIYFAEELVAENQAWYGLEFDVDIDDRGDYLVYAPLPLSTEWSADGAAAYEDADEDVGGILPHLPDDGDLSTSGYEVALLQNGIGEDPDLVWIRRNPDDPTSLQIAVKYDLIGDQGFLWSVWADEGMQAPDLQEYNDAFAFERAGSPYPEHVFHPIQEINLIDSTCISWYRYEPQGDEIGLCQVHTEEDPERGWRLCYTAGRDVICSPECTSSCPPGLTGGLFCQPCNLP